MVWPEDACINSVVHSINKLFTIISSLPFKVWANAVREKIVKYLMIILQSSLLIVLFYVAYRRYFNVIFVVFLYGETYIILMYVRS